MKKKVKPVPDDYNTVTPYLIVTEAKNAIEFYKKAFGAKEISRLMMGDGKVGHAELMIGNTRVMLADEFPEWGMKSASTIGDSPVMLMLFVEDADKVVNLASKSGAKILSPVQDQFYGDRSGTIEDPFGHKWTVSTHIEDVSPEEMRKRADMLFPK